MRVSQGICNEIVKNSQKHAGVCYVIISKKKKIYIYIYFFSVYQKSRNI